LLSILFWFMFALGIIVPFRATNQGPLRPFPEISSTATNLIEPLGTTTRELAAWLGLGSDFRIVEISQRQDSNCRIWPRMAQKTFLSTTNGNSRIFLSTEACGHDMTWCPWPILLFVNGQHLADYSITVIPCRELTFFAGART
jgi:hypothetical protein